ncbi:MAG TPA: tRNA (adenosine(37)-N6)-threonylcarbamoyltransferase complex dimerization subunit type 1 TsaB [Candidatus Saccharimonadales bacterium]|nr:tRNA (adenosine(37)-N6)-threonylcarbamoyltransferase complex dimerization subunit type 1 TsaB [Candidatus Saccharimonadales bacterium]
MKTIYIDTASNQELTVSLTINGDTDVVTRPLEKQKAQVVLPILESLLEKHAITLIDLDRIEVNTGPGSFTGVRVGVSIANALSFALGIPANNILVTKEATSVEPVY